VEGVFEPHHAVEADPDPPSHGRCDNPGLLEALRAPKFQGGREVPIRRGRSKIALSSCDSWAAICGGEMDAERCANSIYCGAFIVLASGVELSSPWEMGPRDERSCPCHIWR
jgi:hypothetical protein